MVHELKVVLYKLIMRYVLCMTESKYAQQQLIPVEAQNLYGVSLFYTLQVLKTYESASTRNNNLLCLGTRSMVDTVKEGLLKNSCTVIDDTLVYINTGIVVSKDTLVKDFPLFVEGFLGDTVFYIPKKIYYTGVAMKLQTLFGLLFD